RASRTSPRPPKRLVPPITAAAMASISSVPPPAFRSTLLRRAARTTPPSPAIPPEIMKTITLTRATLMPARRAASAFPPRAPGVPADGVDMPTEGRALGEECQDQQRRNHQEQDERDATVLVADDDRHDGDHGHRQDL